MTAAEKVASILKETMESDEINDFEKELNIDSVLFIKIIVQLEELFECEIPASKLLLSELNTVTKIAAVIESII